VRKTDSMLRRYAIISEADQRAALKISGWPTHSPPKREKFDRPVEHGQDTDSSGRQIIGGLCISLKSWCYSGKRRG